MNYSIYAITTIFYYQNIWLLNFRDQKILNKFSKRLKLLRSHSNMSQEELAYTSGLSLSQIARIETAKTNPTLCTIITIANTLKVHPRELMDF